MPRRPFSPQRKDVDGVKEQILRFFYYLCQEQVLETSKPQMKILPSGFLITLLRFPSFVVQLIIHFHDGSKI